MKKETTTHIPVKSEIVYHIGHGLEFAFELVFLMLDFIMFGFLFSMARHVENVDALVFLCIMIYVAMLNCIMITAHLVRISKYETWRKGRDDFAS